MSTKKPSTALLVGAGVAVVFAGVGLHFYYKKDTPKAPKDEKPCPLKRQNAVKGRSLP
jgi:hypothetical protein